MSIDRFHDIDREIQRALAAGYPLTVEYDAGEVTLYGDDLRQAWDDMTLSDPFTIATVHDDLTPGQLEAVRGEGGVFQAWTDTHSPGASFSDVEGVGAGLDVKVWWSSTNPGELVVQIDTEFEPDGTNFRVMLNDATLFRHRPERAD